MIAELRTRVRKSPALSRFATPFLSSYRLMWELLALNPEQARKEMGAGADEAGFRRAGLRDAARLAPYIPENGKVFDLGCGIGRVLEPLAPYCDELHGADVSRGMLRLARKRLKEQRNVRLFRCNGRDLAFIADGTYDLSYSLQTFHILEREDMLRSLIELRRITRAGGVVYVEFQDLENEELAEAFKTYTLESALLPTSRRRFSTEPEVRVFARLAGFEDVEVIRGGRTMTLIAHNRAPAAPPVAASRTSNGR